MTFWVLKVSLNPTVSAQYVGNTLEIAVLRGFSVTNVKNGIDVECPGVTAECAEELPDDFCCQ